MDLEQVRLVFIIVAALVCGFIYLENQRKIMSNRIRLLERKVEDLTNHISLISSIVT